ncbi:hypothetical protein SDJN03_08058, partial [Cucurbita argyrosperma subsp. sororia]
MEETLPPLNTLFVSLRVLNIAHWSSSSLMIGFWRSQKLWRRIFLHPSSFFDKIDVVLHLIETFPLKFDDAVDKIPCFNQVVLLDWVMTLAISLLKFMITILMNWGRDGTRDE